MQRGEKWWTGRESEKIQRYTDRQIDRRGKRKRVEERERERDKEREREGEEERVREEKIKSARER